MPPLDPLYLSWKLRTLEYRARFIELADDVNLGMPRYVVDRVAAALNDERKSLASSRILVLGVAYKKDVDDVRESPALEVIRHLLARGAEVSFADPHVETVTVGSEVFDRVPLTSETLHNADAVVVVTHHTAFPWADIAAHSRLIVDSRGVVPRNLVRGTLVPLSGPAARNAKTSESDSPTRSRALSHP